MIIYQIVLNLRRPSWILAAILVLILKTLVDKFRLASYYYCAKQFDSNIHRYYFVKKSLSCDIIRILETFSKVGNSKHYLHIDNTHLGDDDSA